MSEETKKRLITITSTVLASLAASKLADRFLEEPEERGVADDTKEALLKAVFSLGSTILASMIIRNIVSKRWGS